MRASSVYDKGAISVKIEGLEEINRRLDSLKQNIAKRMLVEAMKKSLITMKEDAEKKAPFGPRIERTHKKSGARYTNVPGYLKRSFKIVKPRQFDPFTIEVRLINTAYYAYWVEFGHKIVKVIGGKKRVVGHARPTPYMRTAFDANKDRVVDVLTAAIRAGLDKRGV